MHSRDTNSSNLKNCLSKLLPQLQDSIMAKLSKHTGPQLLNSWITLTEEIQARLKDQKLILGPKVISLGCGRAREALAAKVSFEANRQSDSQEFLYIGIDLNQADLSKASELHEIMQTEQELNKAFQFIAADLCTLSDTLKKYENADLIISRHQNYLSNPEVWSKIFRNGLRLLNTGGHFLITSFTKFEHEAAVANIINLNCEKLISTSFSQARIIRKGGLNRLEMREDGFYAVFKKL